MTTKRLNKVAKITLIFWLMKIVATTLGETLGDFISMTLKSWIHCWHRDYLLFLSVGADNTASCKKIYSVYLLAGYHRHHNPGNRNF